MFTFFVGQRETLKVGQGALCLCYSFVIVFDFRFSMENSYCIIFVSYGLSEIIQLVFIRLFLLIVELMLFSHIKGYDHI